MGGCENYGPFLGTLNNRCRSIIGTQKGALIFTTTHMGFSFYEVIPSYENRRVQGRRVCPSSYHEGSSPNKDPF